MARAVSPARIFAYVHDYIRILWFLRRGITAYEASKRMMTDLSSARARLEGLRKAGIVDVRQEGRKVVYYLKHPCIRIVGFGVIKVEDDTVNVYIDPITDFHKDVLHSEPRIEVVKGGC